MNRQVILGGLMWLTPLLALAMSIVPAVPVTSGRAYLIKRYEIDAEDARRAARDAVDWREHVALRQKRLARVTAAVRSMGRPQGDGEDRAAGNPWDRQTAERQRLEFAIGHLSELQRRAVLPTPPGVWGTWKGLMPIPIWDTDGYLVCWTILAIEVGLILVLVGGMLTVVIRRERRKAAAA